MTADARPILSYAILCAATLVVAGLRIAGLESPAFQASAHLFVGGLFGMWAEGGKSARPALWLALLLSGVELACFVLGIGGHS